MPDKAKNSHIERTVYVAPTVQPGDSVHWGDWQDTEIGTWYNDRDAHPNNPLGRYRARGLPMTIIELATGSDYSGSLVEHSNARVLKEQFPWLVELHGGHGTFGVAYLGKRENQNPALIEAIDALTDYPLVDDDDHSNLEFEKAAEAWEEDGRDEWKRALVTYFDAQDEDHEHDLDECEVSLLDWLWWDCTERLRGGESHLNEQGDQIYFPIDDVIEKIERNWPGLDKPSYDGTRPSINVQLETLAVVSRIEE
jgi:hypothetical protein